MIVLELSIACTVAVYIVAMKNGESIESGFAEDLIYYGLEYKYLTLYVIGQLTYEEMVTQLEIAIHQFAKRQMTWFRGMERRGFEIHWIDSALPMEEKLKQIIQMIKL